jgi:hypothetical protein
MSYFNVLVPYFNALAASLSHSRTSDRLTSSLYDPQTKQMSFMLSKNGTIKVCISEVCFERYEKSGVFVVPVDKHHPKRHTGKRR